jgi:hypothetical protein
MKKISGSASIDFVDDQGNLLRIAARQSEVGLPTAASIRTEHGRIEISTSDDGETLTTVSLTLPTAEKALETLRALLIIARP